MSTALYVDAGIQASKYCNVGTFAVLVFDYCVTLEAESQWIWHRKWTFVRLIFTISWYLPFFGIGMTFAGELVLMVDRLFTKVAHGRRAATLRTQYYPGENCAEYGTASNVLHILSVVAAEGLLITRIYASWNSKRLLTSLLAFSVICVVTSYILSDTKLVSNSTNTTPIYLPNMIGVNIPDPGDCLFMGGRNNVFNYAALLLFELVLFCLMLFIRFGMYKNTVGPLQKTFFKDTMKYMICIMIMSSFSILLTMFPPVTWVAITDSPQIVIHSVLASRILFNLRESEGHMGAQHTSAAAEVSEIQFAGGQLSTSRSEV
ncbi:uncharacterized protein EDB91DRAFT_1244047 [Suillus paluster]|uniref:uncharacterized protein n=1 Tax=Suillus paluster TaxID=48578 RepID=UPI001B87062A|nr:uncharacterized protein EDB91DRAFT_1244047 [Suillus paluster]KAG1750465.1 hypothetical protein EDB91DRAFT_1244047 [Suillus paluster]